MTRARNPQRLEPEEYLGGTIYFATAGSDANLAEIPAAKMFAEEVVRPAGTTRVIADCTALDAQIDELLALLEGLAEPIRDELFARVERLLPGLALSRLPAASGAGDDLVIGQFALPGLDEVLAAARAAREHQFHGSTPRG